VGTTILHYDARAINDLHQMLKQHGDLMEMGSKDEKQRTTVIPFQEYRPCPFLK